jgi:hypothetical protein
MVGLEAVHRMDGLHALTEMVNGPVGRMMVSGPHKGKEFHPGKASSG